MTRPLEHMPETLTVCPATELPKGERRRVAWDDIEILVVNCDGEILAIEDRCSHDDGDLGDGDVNASDCTIECPRHGALFDLRTGAALTLPAYQPVRSFPVRMDGDTITLEVD